MEKEKERLAREKEWEEDQLARQEEREEAKRRKVQEERERAEDLRKRKLDEAEQKRRLGIQSNRNAAKVCIMCGKPLSLLRKLFGVKRHRKCTEFIE